MDDVAARTRIESAPARPRWFWFLGVGAAIVLLLSGASAHVRNADTTSVDTTALRPAYQGHYVTPDDVATLQAQGLATAEVLNRELVCQGVELYFDTPTERDAYVAGYDARFPNEPPYLAGDPCSPYRDSPAVVAGG